MTQGELVAAAGGVAVTVLLALVIVVSVSLLRSLRDLRGAIGAVQQAALDLRAAVDTNTETMQRADQVLTAAQTAYLGAAKPVVKAMALGAGTARAARRLRNAE